MVQISSFLNTENSHPKYKLHNQGEQILTRIKAYIKETAKL